MKQKNLGKEGVERERDDFRLCILLFSALLLDHLPYGACKETIFYFQTEPSGPSCSPEAGGEGAAGVAVQEVDGEALEGVSIGHRPPHCVLELLVAAGDAGAALHLVGGQC